MKKYLIVVWGTLLFTLLFAINVTSVKAVVTPEDFCEFTLSGTWVPGSGTCRFSVPVSTCPSGLQDIYPVYPFVGNWISPTCVPVSNGSNGDLIMGSSTVDTGRSDLILASPANIYIHYAPTTCSFGCKLSTVLSKPAKQALNDLDITIYSKAKVTVKGNPILNSYRICFVTDFLETATIYKYSGSWIPTGTTLYGGVACAYGSGTAQFALGN